MRARASATPPDNTSSSSGSTSCRSRTRVNRTSSLCGSSQTGSPSSAHAALVAARRTVSSGRSHGGSHWRMPARERAPEPRPSPRRTVSAWSSRVWPSRIGLSGWGRAPRSAARRARRAAASIPPGPTTSTGPDLGPDAMPGEQRDRGRGPFRRPGLQLMIDDDGAHAVGPADPRRGEGEGERVRPAGAADEQRRTPRGGGQGVERGPHRPPQLVDRRFRCRRCACAPCAPLPGDHDWRSRLNGRTPAMPAARRVVDPAPPQPRPNLGPAQPMIVSSAQFRPESVAPCTELVIFAPTGPACPPAGPGPAVHRAESRDSPCRIAGLTVSGCGTHRLAWAVRPCCGPGATTLRGRRARRGWGWCRGSPTPC